MPYYAQQNADGSYDVYAHIRVTDPAAFLETGAATMTITPFGGTTNLPVVMDGAPGMAPRIDSVTPTALAPGSTPTATLVETDPGGPGTPSRYTLTLGIPRGQDGNAGALGSILGSSDFLNTPSTAGQIPVFDPTSGLVSWAIPRPVVPAYTVPGTAFTALAATSATPNGIIVSQTIPAQTFRWRPRVEGDLEVTGAVGMRIDAQVMMGLYTATDATVASSGTQVAYGRGREDTLAVHLGISPLFGVAMAPGDATPAAVVAAGTSVKFVLSAVRQYGSAAWSTAQALGELRIYLDPV